MGTASTKHPEDEEGDASVRSASDRLRAEAQSLAADPADREEAAAVLRDVEDLRRR